MTVYVCNMNVCLPLTCVPEPNMMACGMRKILLSIFTSGPSREMSSTRKFVPPKSRARKSPFSVTNNNRLVTVPLSLPSPNKHCPICCLTSLPSLQQTLPNMLPHKSPFSVTNTDRCILTTLLFSLSHMRVYVN